MKPMDDESPDKIAELKKLLEIDDGEKTSPEEVVEAIQLVLAIMEEAYGELEKQMATTRKDAKDAADGTDRKGRAVRKETLAAVAALRTTVNDIMAWRKLQEKRNLETDVDELYALDSEKSTAIIRLRADIRKLKGKNPKTVVREGKPYIPKHEWEGSSLRFETSPGVWGEWVDLRGPGGGLFSGWGSSMGVQKIRAGSSNVHIDGDGANVSIRVDEGGGSGSLSLEEPSGAVNDSNTLFVFSEKPFLIVMNHDTYRENHGWTWDSGSLTATMYSPAGVGGDIYGLIQSS